MPSTVDQKTDIASFIASNAKRYGIPKYAVKPLKDFGIFDARALTLLPEAELFSIPGISEKIARALIRAAIDTFRGPLFQAAADYARLVTDERRRFTTGSRELDALLGGGMPTGAVCELVGSSRTGKTQLCLTCAVTAQLPEDRGGLDRPVIFIDTENSFRLSRYLGIGQSFGLTHDSLLKNLFVVRADLWHLFSSALDCLLGYVQALIPGLIVLDSFIVPFKEEFSEQRDWFAMQRKLSVFIARLKRIATGFNCSIIITNQVEENFGLSSAFSPVKATGGHALSHASDIRLFLKKLKGNMRRAKLEHCSWLPEGQADFYITAAGISDEKSVPKLGRRDARFSRDASSSEVSREAVGAAFTSSDAVTDTVSGSVSPSLSGLLEGVAEATAFKEKRQTKNASKKSASKNDTSKKKAKSSTG